MYQMSAVRNAGDDVGVDFDLEVDGVVQSFTVSTEVIEDLTRSPGKLRGKDLVDEFHKVASRIAEVAQRAIGTQADGRVLLTSKNF